MNGEISKLANQLKADALRIDALLIEQRADRLAAMEPMMTAEGWREECLKQVANLRREAKELREEADKLEMGTFLAPHFLRIANGVRSN